VILEINGTFIHHVAFRDAFTTGGLVIRLRVQWALPLPLSLLQILCRSIRVREGKVVIVSKVVASKVVVVKKAVTGKLMHEAGSKVLRYIRVPSLH
jgi:hypothetical protein